MYFIRSAVASVLVFFCCGIHSAEASSFGRFFQGPHQFSLGPEFFHMRRTKEGGGRKDGWLYGVHFRYDRVRPCSLYWGMDAYWAKGTLRGSTSSGSPCKSIKTDMNVEGRLGYTFAIPRVSHLLFSPYVGGGGFWGINNFQDPTPVPIKLRNTFQFVSLGFRSQISCSPSIDLGLNFATKFMLDGRSNVCDDPIFDDDTLIMESKNHYEVEVPITYTYCCGDRTYQWILEPFYRYRHYGHHDNFPFDFLETRFQIFGVMLLMSTSF
ncbi:MAG: hypothetical protein H7A37_10075 [Chlamydiales bacterium]|nr:hypothetical protein [Chlamydiia bacterium]MCP5508623.1 hypothetical protein [Chlamydiales bacterium]